MLTADRLIAISLMALSLYFMWHATVLPIGWNGTTGGPGGGAFPFWLSAVMLGCSGLILLRSFLPDARASFTMDSTMVRPLLAVVIALVVTIALIPVAGAYVALPLFLLWYLRIFGGHGWTLTLSLTILTPIATFLFFEAVLKILLPKGITEPLFLPLYAIFF